MSAVFSPRARPTFSSAPPTSSPLEDSEYSLNQAHPRTDIRSYVAELLVATKSKGSEAIEASNLLHELATDTGFRGQCVRPLLLSELAEYEISFLQRIKVGEPLPQLISFLDGSTRYVLPVSAAELIPSERERWIRIVSKHLHSLAFQPEWTEDHLVQFKHALILGDRLFMANEAGSILSELQKSALANATTVALEKANNIATLLKETRLCAETILRAASFLTECQAQSSGEVLQAIFRVVDQVYQEMTPRECDVGDYFKFEGTVWESADNDDQGSLLEHPDSGKRSEWHSEDEDPYDQAALKDVHNPDNMEAEEASIADENALYHALETLHLALLRALRSDPIIMNDSEFWSDVVYNNDYYMPGMPIAIQGLANSSKESLSEFVEPLLYALSRDSAPIVHLLALLEIQNVVNSRFNIDLSQILLTKYFELPEKIQSAVFDTIESTVSSDLTIMASLSESELCEEEMAALIGEFLTQIDGKSGD